MTLETYVFKSISSVYSKINWLKSWQRKSSGSIEKTYSSSKIGTVDSKLHDVAAFEKTNNWTSEILQVESKIPNINDLTKKNRYCGSGR